MTIREAVIANARSPRPIPPAQLARELGVMPAVVHEATSRARARGEVPRSRRQVTRAIAAPDAVTLALAHAIREAGPLRLEQALTLVVREWRGRRATGRDNESALR